LRAHSGRDFVWNLGAGLKRVSCVSGRTGTDGLVVNCIADGIHSTSSLARIQTLLPDASLVRRALAVDEALGVAVGGSSEVPLLAAADYPGSLKLAD